jgi:F-box interacting protein
MSIFPQDLITSILFRLPVESLLRFRCVSKPWLALIKEPHFTNMRIDTKRRQIFETGERKGDDWVREYYLANASNENGFGEPVKIIPRFNPSENPNHASILGCCCNGLACIYKTRFEIAIWNPSIRKHKKIPFEPLDDNHKHLLNLDDPADTDKFSFGFGYDPVNKDFKVLRIVEFRKSSSTPVAVEVKIYSLKANSWKRVEDQWPFKERFESFHQPAFTNGALHWLADGPTGQNTILLTFDLTTEKFGVQTLSLKTLRISEFQAVGGSLSVCAYNEVGELEIWVKYGVESSWNRLCKVPKGTRYYPSLAFSKDNKKVLMEDYYHRRSMMYDTEKETLKFFENGQHIPNHNWTTAYVESLFLLDGDTDR